MSDMHEITEIRSLKEAFNLRLDPPAGKVRISGGVLDEQFIPREVVESLLYGVWTLAPGESAREYRVLPKPERD